MLSTVHGIIQEALSELWRSSSGREGGWFGGVCSDSWRSSLKNTVASCSQNCPAAASPCVICLSVALHFTLLTEKPASFAKPIESQVCVLVFLLPCETMSFKCSFCIQITKVTNIMWQFPSSVSLRGGLACSWSLKFKCYWNQVFLFWALNGAAEECLLCHYQRLLARCSQTWHSLSQTAQALSADWVTFRKLQCIVCNPRLLYSCRMQSVLYNRKQKQYLLLKEKRMRWCLLWNKWKRGNN